MYIIDKIRKYFETSEWQHRFSWEQEPWGAKYESVKSLAKKINHPYTSLYIPIHQLEKESFVCFKSGLIIYERKLDNDSDAGSKGSK